MMKCDKKKIGLTFLVACGGICVLSIITIILMFSRFLFHSDCMGYYLQAIEQAKQHVMFPNRFHYTTTIFGFSTSLYMIPFLNLQNTYLIHEIGSIVAVVLFTILLWAAFWNNKKIAALVTILFLLPTSYTRVDMLFFQSAYINVCVLIVLNLFVLRLLLRNGEIQKSRRSLTMSMLCLLVYLVVVFFTNYAGISNYVYVEIPVLGAIFFILWMKYGIDIKSMVKEENRFIIIIAITVIGMGLGFASYLFLCNRLGFNIETSTGAMLHPERIRDIFWYIFPNLLRDFGVTESDSLFTPATIKVCMAYLFFIVSVIVAPCYMLKQIKKYDLFDRFIILFSSILHFFVLFLVFVGGFAEDRYYLPGMLGALILTAYFVCDVTKDFYTKIGYGLYLFVVVFALLVHGNYYVVLNNVFPEAEFSYEGLMNPKVNNELVSSLKERGLKYGFASFWNSYSNMMAANCDITIVAYDKGNPLMPYYFDGNNPNNVQFYACSEDMYNPLLHQGRCFVVVADDETIPEEYYQKAVETYTVSRFTVLIFNDNINFLMG